MRGLGIALIVAGALSWFFPGFNGFFFERSNISSGEGQIIGAILTVGGLILIALSNRSEPQ